MSVFHFFWEDSVVQGMPVRRSAFSITAAGVSAGLVILLFGVQRLQ